METKTPMVFVKHITAAQRGNENSIRYLCDHTSVQFVKICRKYNLTDSEVAEVLDKAYGRIFADIKSVKDPLDFMSWADGLVRECCEETTKSIKKAPAAKPKKAASKKNEATAEESKTSTLVEEKKISVPVEETKVPEPVEAPKAAAATAASPVSAKSAEQILKEVEAAVSSPEEEGVFEDTKPAVSPEQAAPAAAAPAAAAPKTEAPKADAGAPETPVERQAVEEPKEEPDVAAPTKDRGEAEAREEEDYNFDEDSDDGDDDVDDEEENEGILGLLKEYRTRVLFVVLGVFIFGACVGIGYAISRGLTSRDAATAGTVSVVQVPSTESGIESSTQAEVESAASSAAESAIAAPVPMVVDSAEDPGTIDAPVESAAQGSNTDNQPSPNTADPAESVDPNAGEVTAKPNIGEYLGETFASVFRDYPNISRSVYRGELSLANEHIGFIGSYDATKPVSSTIVESVSLLSAAENYNIDGFYIGMSSADAEALASAGGYTAQEQANEYVDAEGNILTLTIDGESIRNVTLRLVSAAQTSIEMADEVPEEPQEEITNEGVG